MDLQKSAISRIPLLQIRDHISNRRLWVRTGFPEGCEFLSGIDHVDGAFLELDGITSGRDCDADESLPRDRHLRYGLFLFPQ